VQDRAEIVVRFRLARIELERAPVARFRLGEAACILEPQTFLIEGGSVGQG
jgi:hypothetical protein